jgi:autotransporter-associated beta strand protein
MKRILSLMLLLLLAFNLAVPAEAKDDAVGTTIRLSEMSGKVKVKNASGKDVNARTDMRLYNGYTLETGKDGTAYISLDDTKALKLDVNGKIELRKSGKKLEISLLSGTIFYGVEAPLSSNESLEIRTSTMVTGVRGSHGWATLTSSCMLHGFARVMCMDQASGQSVMTSISNGEYVEFAPGTAQQQGSTAEEQQLNEKGFSKGELKNEDVVAVAAEAVADNQKLKEEINSDGSNLNGDSIAEGAAAKRQEETVEIQGTEAGLRQRTDEQSRTIAVNDAADKAAGITDKVPFENSGSSGQSQGTSAGTTVPGSGVIGPDIVRPERNDEKDVIEGDSKQLMEELKNGTATIQTGGARIVYSDVSVEAGQTLNISGGGSVTITNLNISEGANVRVEGGTTLTVMGEDATQAGTLTNNGTVNNNAELSLVNGGTIVNNGTYVNNGVLAISGSSSFTGGTVVNSGTIIVNGNLDVGSIVDGGGVVIRN